MEWQSLLGVKSFLSSFDRFCLPVTLNLISVQKNELNRYCCINIMWRWDQELLQNRALIVSEQILIFDPPVHRELKQVHIVVHKVFSCWHVPTL